MRIILTIVAASLVHVASAQIRPPNLSADNLPDTAFTCEDKVTGGYYADMEADCQLFHVCVQVSEYEFQDFHFLCPNDTVFDQQHLVCTNWFEVDCHAQLAFFTNDFGIKRGPSFEDEDIKGGVEDGEPEQNSFLGFSGQAGLGGRARHRSRNTGRGQLEVGRRRSGFNQRRFPVRNFEEYEDLEQDEDVSNSIGPDPISTQVLPSITGSTPIPLGFTTTIRPAGRSGIIEGGVLSGRNLRNFGREEESSLQIDKPTEATFRKPSFSKFGRDGRRPKVKSNIRAKLANGGRKKFFNKPEKPRRKSGRKVNLDQGHRQKIEFVEPIEDEIIEEPFTGPEVRPDGRPPRVKADRLRAEQNKGETTTLEPFIEKFFASPSSPKPFIFQGSPTPRSIRSTSQPFFIPTVKGPSTHSPLSSQAPLSFSINNEETLFEPTTPPTVASETALTIEDDEENDIFNEEEKARNRFVSRPNPTDNFRGRKRTRGRHRIVVENQPSVSFSHGDVSINDSNEQLSTPSEQEEKTETQNTFIQFDNETQKPRVKSNIRQRKKFRKNLNSFHGNSLDADNSVNSLNDEKSGCNNPFQCPRKFAASGGRRPRVKSNVRAKKRNFWHKQKSNRFGRTKISQIGVGQQNRKVRRGRKQVPSPKIAGQTLNEIHNDDKDSIFDEDQSNVQESEHSSITQLGQFFPTSRTTTKEETSTTTVLPPLEENSDQFEDFFDQENDLFVASSTVSSVVFKGSPAPGIGFFSSPNPWNDGKVSFTSPSPFGNGFGPSGRPSFNNIGAHIDLGPKQKILEPEQLFFVSSTMSNKIFIGSDEGDLSTTTPPPVITEEDTANDKVDDKQEELKINFPSFPIRGGIGSHTSFPFRSKPNFPGLKQTGGIPFSFTREKATKKKVKESPREPEDVAEDNTTLTTEAPMSATEPITTFVDPVTKKSFFKNKKGPRVKSNLLFNRRKHPGQRNKFAQKFGEIATTTTTTEIPMEEEKIFTETPFESETGTPTLEEEKLSVEIEEESIPAIPKRRGRFQGRRPFSLVGGAKNIGIANRLLNRRLRGKKFGQTKPETSSTSFPKSTIVEEQITEVSVTEPSNVLSVESELLEDNVNEEFDNNIDEKILPKQKRKKWAQVKKANLPPQNANIRVDFKKAVEKEDVETHRKFFVKPDGRKPRVKSNIRARFANRGKFPFGQQQENSFRHNTEEEEEETFNGSSTHLDVAPFQGSTSEELPNDDNTEKREINIYDAPLANSIILKNEIKNKNIPGSLQPVILNTRLESVTPPLPTPILEHVRHITSLSSLPPLPSFSKSHPTQSYPVSEESSFAPEETENLLEKIVVQSSPTSSVSEISTSISSSVKSNPATSLRKKLSAFRALQKQTVQQSSSSDINTVVISRDPSQDNADLV